MRKDGNEGWALCNIASQNFQAIWNTHGPVDLRLYRKHSDVDCIKRKDGIDKADQMTDEFCSSHDSGLASIH